MPVTVRIPSPLRRHTDGAATVEVEAGTVREVISELDAAHNGIAERLLDDGELRRFVNVFVEDEDIRYQDGLDTPVSDGAVVSIVPAVAGG
jgi:sulfur-carrier protein